MDQHHGKERRIKRPLTVSGDVQLPNTLLPWEIELVVPAVAEVLGRELAESSQPARKGRRHVAH